MLVAGNLVGGESTVTLPFVRSQAASLAGSGWQVVFGPIDDRTSLRGLRCNARRLRAEIARIRPSLVHAQYGSATAALAARVKGALPLVISFCGDDLLGTPVPGWKWRLRSAGARLLSLWAAERAAAVIVKSRNLLDALPQRLRRHATILPNGVDTDWFTPVDRAVCRRALGWDAHAKVVLFNASQREEQHRKNPALARAAMVTVTRSEPNASLHMMANATPEEVRLMMNAADCLLVTSLHEGSPNVVKEAMASNLPVVAVPCGDVRERLIATWPGAVCDYDADTLGRAIVEVLRVGCRSNGRAQIQARGLISYETSPDRDPGRAPADIPEARALQRTIGPRPQPTGG